MPFGVTAAVTSGLVAAGIGDATAGILAAGLVDAGTGALIGGGLGAITGGNIGKDALYGGLGGALFGGGSALAGNLLGDTAAAGASGVGASGAVANASDPMAGAAGISPGVGQGFDATGDSVPLNSADATSFGSSAPGVLPSTPATPSTPSGNPLTATENNSGNPSTGIGSWLSNNSGTLKNLATVGAISAPVLQSLLNPLPKYNVQGTANSVMATNPSFNASLPQYSMQNTASPYTGNWYTYGQQPEQAMYNARPVATGSKTGGLIGYAQGGRVQHMAMGGAPMPPAMGAPPMPQQALPQGMPPQSPLAMGQQQSAPAAAKNPLATQNGFNIGKAIGQHLKASGALANVQSGKDAYKIGHSIGTRLKNPTFTGQGAVSGAGGGQDDAIPAKLSDGEFVFPADVVSKLGDGSSDAGGKKLMKVIHGVRAHTATKGFPPKSKANPLAYVKGKA